MTGNHEESLNENEYLNQSRPAPQPETTIDYTQQQVDAVNRILHCTDYYKVLQVPREATDSDVKNAYRRLALEIHPDKNKCPGATEAFKEIGNAFAVLKDANERAYYDHYGLVKPRRGVQQRTEDRDTEQPRRGRQQKNNKNNQSQRQRQKREKNPGKSLWERLWETLWKILYVCQWMYQLMYQLMRKLLTFQLKILHTEINNQRLVRTAGLLLMLIYITILVSLLVKNNFLMSDPSYSIQKSGKYLLEKHTTVSRIPYYVEKNFDKYYDGDLPGLETTIEKEYIAMLRQNCYKSISAVIYPHDPTPNSNAFLSTSTVIYPLKLTPGLNVFISSSNVIYPLKPAPKLDINCYFKVPRFDILN